MSLVDNKGYIIDPYRNFIHTSRYARWLDDKGRRETWAETVARYVGFMRKHMTTNYGYAKDDPDFDLVEKAILEHEIMPSMRALMAAGPAMEADNISAYNCSFIAVDSLRAFDEAMYILMNGTGVGFSVEQEHVKDLPVIADEFEQTETTIVVEDSKMGWAKAYKELISLLVNGQIPNWDTRKVRPAGARLKTFGGRASGPEPLKELFRFTTQVFKNAKGRRLKSIEAHDIMCKIGEVVVVGGVRRCLPAGSLVHTKRGMLPIEDVQVGELVMTSKGYHKVLNKFDQGTQALVKVHTQDSYFECTPNHRVAVLTGQDQYVWKEAGLLEVNDRVVAPSVGIEGRKVSLPEFSYVRPKHSTTCADITIPELDTDMAWFLGLIQGDGYVRLTSKSGEVSIACAKNYPVIIEQAHKQLARFGVNTQQVDYDNYCVVRTKSKQLATYLHGWLKQPKTVLKVPSFMWAAPTDIKLAFVSGLMDADSSVKTRPANVCVTAYETYAREITLLLSSCGLQARLKKLTTKSRKPNWQPLYAVSAINNRTKAVLNEFGTKKITGTNVEQNTNTYPREMLNFNYPASFPWSKTNNSLIPVTVKAVEFNSRSAPTWDIEVETMNEFFCNGYLMHNSALISLSNLDDFEMAKAKSGQWWESQPQRSLANNSAVYDSKPNTAQFLREWRNLYESKSGERGIYNAESVRKHIQKAGRRDASKVRGTNPCAEILLRSLQFCNLTEIVIRAEDTEEDLLRKVELATLLGTWQSTLTNFKYIRKAWKNNCEEERLLGVSLTGIFGNKLTSTNGPELAALLNRMRERAIEVNQKEAEDLGIQASTAITCVKPSGTVSQLVGVSSGIHPWHSEYYLRSVRADNKDPLTTFLKASDVPNEPEALKPESTTVFSFPIKAPEGAIVNSHLTAVQHLELWKTYRECWTEHNPSVTISVREDEWMDVGAWVYKNFDHIGGVSFLPATDHIYRQAPYQEITKEQYEEAVSKMPAEISWNDLSMFETEDSTSGTQELACSAGVCEIVDITSTTK
jgi:hypothetical protein